MNHEVILKQAIREVPDFPKPGIHFYDITSLLLNPEAFNLTLRLLTEELNKINFDKIVAIESRGFIFAGALAAQLNKPLILARKPGKLPGKTYRQAYDLEYGQNQLELQQGYIAAQEKIVILDDVLATGGTALAACQLVEQNQGNVVRIMALIGLPFLPFEKTLKNYSVFSLINYQN